MIYEFFEDCIFSWFGATEGCFPQEVIYSFYSTILAGLVLLLAFLPLKLLFSFLRGIYD